MVYSLVKNYSYDTCKFNKQLIAVFSLLFCVALAQQKRPNIIVILSDDVGFEEFGVYDVKKG